MITADQLVAHAIGDYVLQSDWMANEKTKHSFAAACHALSYGLPFVLFRPSLTAFTVIVATHFIIDRWRLARFAVYAKNFLAPRKTVRLRFDESGVTAGGIVQYVERAEVQQWWYPWAKCSGTGYFVERPPWLSVWLLIIADNVMHVLINGVALKWL